MLFQIRLELGPLVPRLPILSGAVNLTFMEEPFLDFDIKVAALPVAVRSTTTTHGAGRRCPPRLLLASP